MHFQRGLDADGKALACKLEVQARALALDGADADVALLRRLVDAEIIAAHVAAVDEPGELIARVDTAAPGIGMIVDAGLVELRRIDAVEAIGDVAELDGVAVVDDSGGGIRGSCEENGAQK